MNNKYLCLAKKVFVQSLNPLCSVDITEEVLRQMINDCSYDEFSCEENHLTKKHILHQELNSFVGLNEVKYQISNLIDFINISKKRQKQGLPIYSLNLHLVFTGSPGTGKTTFARLIGKIYKELGVLKKGHCIEIDRSNIVAGYIGQTAINMNKLIESALDGVLFIDEAYALKSDSLSSEDFGQEAIDTLLKKMEDYRDRLVVIVAGYPTEMTRFIESNPGLQSRFTNYWNFEDYRPDELLAIFKEMCKKNQYIIESNAEIFLKNKFKQLYVNRSNNFGNGRLVRNIFEKTIERQASRLARFETLSKDNLVSFILEDIPK